MSRIAKELGFADSSPLRKILRNPKRTTSRDRLTRLRGIVARPASASSVSSSTTPTVKRGTPAPPVTQRGADPEAWVSKSQAKEFERSITQLRQSGWTMDALAKRLGYHHGRSLRKTLASGNVRRRVFDAIGTLSAKPLDRSATTAKQQIKSTQSTLSTNSKTSATSKTKTNGTPRFTDRQVSGVTTYLELARQHLDRARSEVERASSASQLLEPGLRALISEIDDLGRRLEL